MKYNSQKIQKTSKVVLVGVWLVQIFLITSVIMKIILAIIAPISINKVHYCKIPINILAPNITFLGLAIITLYFAGKLLKTLKSNYTPFTKENVRTLKTISILLIATEPVYYLVVFVSNLIAEAQASSGEFIKVYTFFGGMIFALDFTVYCIALTFQHGVELQQQSDETL